MIVTRCFKADTTWLGQAVSKLYNAFMVLARVRHAKAACVTVCGFDHYHVEILGNINCHPGTIRRMLYAVSHGEYSSQDVVIKRMDLLLMTD